MGLPEVMEILNDAITIHERKNKDYASRDSSGYENFERSAHLISWFNNDIDKAFVSLIGTKLARLATLLNSNEKPNNESIDDSFLDLTTYCALWGGNYKSRKRGARSNMPPKLKPSTP